MTVFDGSVVNAMIRKAAAMNIVRSPWTGAAGTTLGLKTSA